MVVINVDPSLFIGGVIVPHYMPAYIAHLLYDFVVLLLIRACLLCLRVAVVVDCLVVELVVGILVWTAALLDSGRVDLGWCVFDVLVDAFKGLGVVYLVRVALEDTHFVGLVE